jgi:hypothetical protein
MPVGELDSRITKIASKRIASSNCLRLRNKNYKETHVICKAMTMD